MTRTDRQDARDDGGRPLRIVHVLTRLLRAGAEENTVATCLHQARRGHEVYLVHGDEHDPVYAGGLDPAVRRVHVPEMVHPISPLDDLKALRALRRLYAEIRPDVVHTHQSKAGVLGRLAASPRRSAIVHTVHIAHFLNVGRSKERLYVALERLCSRRTHEIIDVSAGVMQACVERGIGRPGQHRVIHSGMDIERFASAVPRTDGALRPSHGPGTPGSRAGGPDAGGPDATAPFVVLMVAAFEPRKRQEGFIQAMAPVLSRHPQIVVAFCGEGPRLEAARALGERLGVAGQLVFAGYVPDAETYIASADLCVLSSEREGLPRVLVQYAALGKPMVVNHLPGVEDIARDGENAVIVPDDDLDGVAAAVERLFLDRDALEAMERAAESVDVSSWGVERMGSRIEEVYAEALSSLATATDRVAP